MSDRPLLAVVGAGPGIGRAIARRFAREGYRLAVFARGRAEAEAEALRSEGFEATGQALDAADLEAVAATLRGIGPVRVLAWNPVAITRVTPLALPPARLMADLAVSVAGPLAAVQAVVPAMEAGG
ncbi:SDR family NAD(P)-dependent oxidoreductase [Falsiroseomonas sp. HW251]|uniref:SDR family NAD(P)-dependent oxidoreductase n=1 Tax=Falsiroseomonas sp. HW251 TaxID=3390998 RepID=UPI003D31D021